MAPKLDKEEEARQVATLLAVIGRGEQGVSYLHMGLARRRRGKISTVVSKFEEYCIPRENTICERFLFFTREQRESETVDQYLTELRQIAANCDFESITPDQLLWDRLVTGTKTAKVRENLLKEKKLPLEKAKDIARAAESTAVQSYVCRVWIECCERERERAVRQCPIRQQWLDQGL